MAIALAFTGAAFAAFCLWLAVRIINRRERWAKWTLAATIVGLPLIYVLSFGPACWLNERTSKEFILTTGDPDPGSFWERGIGDDVFLTVYRPFFEFADGRPGWRRTLCRWYAEVGTRSARLNVRGNGKFDWYRRDFPPSMIVDETGTYVDNPARHPASNPGVPSESN
ncbi:MAG: hypothetical protein HY290_20375 [Planctomycetia bacterium]|nr:hypothetical protein [Planctomycetia bacterium]